MKIYINLLPEGRKALALKKKRFRNIIRQEVLFLFPLVVFVFTMIGINMVLSVQNSSFDLAYTASGDGGEREKLKLYEEKIDISNKKIAELKKFQSNHYRWTNIIKEVISLVPEGVTLGDFSTKGYEILIVGKAETRDRLMEFKDNLMKSECFDNVEVPSSFLVVRENLDFQMDFSVSRTCLIRE